MIITRANLIKMGYNQGIVKTFSPTHYSDMSIQTLIN